jgi:hypothetical protein
MRRVAALMTAERITATIQVKLNDFEPQTWVADVLARVQDHPAGPIDTPHTRTLHSESEPKHSIGSAVSAHHLTAAWWL